MMLYIAFLTDESHLSLICVINWYYLMAEWNLASVAPIERANNTDTSVMIVSKQKLSIN